MLRTRVLCSLGPTRSQGGSVTTLARPLADKGAVRVRPARSSLRFRLEEGALPEAREVAPADLGEAVLPEGPVGAGPLSVGPEAADRPLVAPAAEARPSVARAVEVRPSAAAPVAAPGAVAAQGALLAGAETRGLTGTLVRPVAGGTTLQRCRCSG